MGIIEVFSCPCCEETQDLSESTYSCPSCGETFGSCCKDKLKECENCGEYFCEDCLDKEDHCDNCQYSCVCEGCGTGCEDEDKEGEIDGFNACKECGNDFCRLCYVVTFEEVNRLEEEYVFIVHCKKCYFAIELKKERERKEERERLIQKKSKVEKE